MCACEGTGAGHLPEAKALSEVAMRPVLRVPDVRHRHLALAEVVVHIDEVEEAVVQCVHHSRRHRQHVLHRLTERVERRPCLRVVLGARQR